MTQDAAASAPAGPRRTGGRGNLVALAATRAVIALSGVVVNVALARWLSRDDFAAYRWIWACVAVAAFGANLGLWQLMTRRVARDPSRASTLLPVALRATALLSVLTGVGIVAYVALADGRPMVVAAAALGAGTLAFNSAAQLVQSTFHGLRRMFLELPAVIVGRVVFVVWHLVALGLGYGLVTLYVGRLVAAAVLFGMLLVSAWRVVGPLHGTPEPGAVAAWIRNGRSFGATVFFGAIAAQADILVLEWMTDADEVARYAAPSSVLLQLAFVANIVSKGFFPRVSQLSADDPAMAQQLTFQARILLLCSVPITVGGAVVADQLVPWLFGDRYADAVGPFLWLLVAVPVRFLNNGYGFALTALDQQGVRARIDTFGAVFNLAANVAVVPFLGASGAAITTLATDVAIHGLLRWRVAGQVTGHRLRGALARTLLPAAPMALVVWALPDLHVLARVALGAVVYVAVGWLVRAWRPSDLGRLAGV